MLRILLAGSVCIFGLLSFAPMAAACPESGCQSLLTVIQVDPVPRFDTKPATPSLSEAGDEAGVRKRDLSKREPKAPRFWTQFRSYAYKRLPKHREQNFAAVWVAMPLATSDGTVPTLGLRGSWW